MNRSLHQHHKATERWNYYKARRKDHTALMFACIAAVMAAVVGIGYLYLSSGTTPPTRGADTSITTTTPTPGPAPEKGLPQRPADSSGASAPSEEAPPSGPAKADAPEPSKILPASFKEDIEDRFGSMDPQR